MILELKELKEDKKSIPFCQTPLSNMHLKGKGGGVYKGWNSHPPSGGLHTKPVQSSDQNMYIFPYIYGPNNYYHIKFVHGVYECSMNPL